MNSFSEGLQVRYKEHVGFVDFISEKYITVCLRKCEDRSKDVCILIYPQQWEDVKLMKESDK